ncbi:MAG: hypothetical protein K5873_04380 [Treponema sp.]|nr:hypothetical protein [Treponema sp.]
MNFKISKEGLELDVTWGKKDYSVSCKIGQLLLKDYCHMMFMQPKVYTEEEVRKRCEDLIPDFIESAKIITENEDKISEEKFDYMELKNELSTLIQKLNADKSKLQKQFKDSQLSQKKYQEKISAINHMKMEKEGDTRKKIEAAAKEIAKPNSRCFSIIRNYLTDNWDKLD